VDRIHVVKSCGMCNSVKFIDFGGVCHCGEMGNRLIPDVNDIPDWCPLPISEQQSATRSTHKPDSTKVCDWKKVTEDGIVCYLMGCGDYWYGDDPEQTNGINYCPVCGRKLRVT